MCAKLTLHSHAWGDFRFIMNFHVEPVWGSSKYTRLKDKYTINDLVKGKVCIRTKWPIRQALIQSGFCKATRSICPPPGWDASSSHVYQPPTPTPSIKLAAVPIRRRKALWEKSVFSKNTTWCPRTGFEPGLIIRPPAAFHSNTCISSHVKYHMPRPLGFSPRASSRELRKIPAKKSKRAYLLQDHMTCK